MLFSVSVAISGLISAATAETILGVTVFTRLGDRKLSRLKELKQQLTAQERRNNTPSYKLTDSGFQQNLQVGSDYRDLHIAADAPKQILGT